MADRAHRRLPAAAALGALVWLFAGAGPMAAWTPATQQTIAWEAAHLAPPDLERQILRRKAAFMAGVLAPFDETDPGRHRKNADGSGRLDKALLEAVAEAVAAIHALRPFDEIVQRLGTVSHFMADANNPLATSADDPEEGRYFVDFLRYAESAEPRFPLVFYGVRPRLERPADVSSLLGETLRRGRALSSLVGLEYRNLDFASGIGRFDDRSTAFGVASVAFSHAVTDVALLLRYIWLEGGGADERNDLPASGTRLLLLPRAVQLAPASSAGGH
ncbi:MAG TPA: hypothetical protein VHR45_20725 [Thermoanaerobaculia bacterium]|nr:hypothetical protein [Thermoanaerobaculia bacterium]